MRRLYWKPMVSYNSSTTNGGILWYGIFTLNAISVSCRLISYSYTSISHWQKNCKVTILTPVTIYVWVSASQSKKQTTSILSHTSQVLHRGSSRQSPTKAYNDLTSLLPEPTVTLQISKGQVFLFLALNFSILTLVSEPCKMSIRTFSFLLKSYRTLLNLPTA